MDYEIIKNIDQTTWFRKIKYYPRTIGDIKLFVLIMDRVGILNGFDLEKIGEMESAKLDIIYATLRIINKIFNKYLEGVTEIIIKHLKRIFVKKMLNKNYELFFDQLVQDLDYFICSFIKNNFPNIDEKMVTKNLLEFLEINFHKSFYRNVMKKISTSCEKILSKNNNIMNQCTTEFVNYSHLILDKPYYNIRLLLNNIFYNIYNQRRMDDLLNMFDSNIDLYNLFNEECSEIEIYSEQKLNSEIMANHNAKNKSRNLEKRQYV
ncbi:MAG: hypothetical protein QXW79_00770 [Thermoplasmata archaeon]